MLKMYLNSKGELLNKSWGSHHVLVSSCAVIGVTLWLNPRSHLPCQTKQQEQTPTGTQFALVTQELRCVRGGALGDKTRRHYFNICSRFAIGSYLNRRGECFKKQNQIVRVVQPWKFWKADWIKKTLLWCDQMLVCVQVSAPPVSTLMTASSPACPVHWEPTSQKWDAPPASRAEGTWSPSAAVLLPFRSVRPKVWKSGKCRCYCRL